jgi:MYXO-CTERM domain-containing protein
MFAHTVTRLISAAALAFASQSALATSTWSFACGSHAGVSCGGTVSPSLQFSGTNTSNTSKVSGWSTTGNTGDLGDRRLEQSTVISWSGGLGVKNKWEGGSPQHAIDNNRQNDFVLLSFAEAVKLTTVGVGWWSHDFDMTILAYTGAGTPGLPENTLNPHDLAAGHTVGLTNDGWSLVGNYLNPQDSYSVPTGREFDINSQGLTSSYWLVGAYNSRVSGGSTSFDSNDYFKLLYAGGHTVTGGGGGNPVPVPGTLALVALGLPFLRRRLAA